METSHHTPLKLRRLESELRASVNAMAMVYQFKEDHLVHKQTDKAIPELEAREVIIAECHSMGYFRVTRTACLVRTDFFWWGLKDQVKKDVKDLQRMQTHACQLY